MTTIERAKSAYRPDNAAIKTPSAIEYEAFVRVTRDLKASQREGAGFGDLVAAINQNRQLWNILAASVLDDQNGLPRDLRANIFYLSEFTRQHSGKVLAKSGTVDVLIEINTSIMSGLRAQQGST